MYKYGNIQVYMWKNKNVKNVKQFVKKVNIYIYIYIYIRYICNYKATSDRNVKPNKKRIYTYIIHQHVK